MLKKINTLLILLILFFAINNISLNQEIYKLHNKNTKLSKQNYKNNKINLDLKLQIEEKNSDIFTEKYAIDKLKMFKPKKVHLLID